MFTEDPEDNFMKDFRNDIDMIFGHTTAVRALIFFNNLIVSSNFKFVFRKHYFS